MTLLQKIRADNRREWWARFEWALDATYSENAAQRQDGWRLIRIMTNSHLITRSERPLIAELIMEMAVDVARHTDAEPELADERASG